MIHNAKVQSGYALDPALEELIRGATAREIYELELIWGRWLSQAKKVREGLERGVIGRRPKTPGRNPRRKRARI